MTWLKLYTSSKLRAPVPRMKMGQSAWWELGLSSTPAGLGEAGAERLERPWLKRYTSKRTFRRSQLRFASSG